MAEWNLGSIGAEVLLLVPETPSTISGSPLERIADRERIYAEQYTGQTIGSTGIAEKFQPALVDLTAGAVLRILEAENSASDNIKLGDFSTKSATSSKGSSSSSYKESGMMKLAELGRKIRFVKVEG